jgi:hypothetical protein
MYIHRSILTLLVFILLIFLVGVDWITAPDGSWYRPFIIAFAIILISALTQWKQEDDGY